MTAIGCKASSGATVALPAAPLGIETPDQIAPQIEYLAVPALRKAWHVRHAKRARSLQGSGTASCDEGQGLHKRQKAKQEMEAASPPKLVTSEFIQSVLKDIGVERGLIWLERTCWLARHLRLQVLREDARERALAHVGICDRAIKVDGKVQGMQMSTLVKEWDSTCQNVLTPLMQEDIVNHFGDDFVFFLKTDPSLGGMEADDSMTHPLSLDMPWAERSLLLEAIDNLLLIPALQRGARVAYLLVFGGRSWEAEIEKVADKLAQLRMVP